MQRIVKPSRRLAIAALVVLSPAVSRAENRGLVPSLPLPQSAATAGGANQRYAERPASATSATTPDPGRPLPLSPPSEDVPDDGPTQQLKPLVTGAASLGIVLGLFLLVVMIMRRGGPKASALVPREVFEVLGRAPLVGRQYAHVVRCANKLLLVHVTPGSVQTITEITDPAEVQRVLELCEGAGGSSPIRKILGQFAAPRERSYFAQPDESELDFSHLDAAHHATR